MSDIVPFLSDQPAFSNKNARIDGLDFESYGKILLDRLVKVDGNFTVGVHGGWGAGKTSFLRVLENMMKNEKKVEEDTQYEKMIPVFFNAWRYEREEHPVVPLFFEIIESCEKKFFWWFGKKI